MLPNYATAYSAAAFVHDFNGDFDAAKPAADETIRLRPHDRALMRCIISKSIADYQTGAYEQAVKVAQNSFLADKNWWWSSMMLAASLSKSNDSDGARAAVTNLLEINPSQTLDTMMEALPFVETAHRKHLEEGLIAAGWRDPK